MARVGRTGQQRRIEEREDGVPDELVDHRAVFDQHGAGGLEIRVENRTRSLGAETFGDRGERGQVGEETGDPPLARPEVDAGLDDRKQINQGSNAGCIAVKQRLGVVHGGISYITDARVCVAGSLACAKRSCTLINTQ